jgi:hypothetical protein
MARAASFSQVRERDHLDADGRSGAVDQSLGGSSVCVLVEKPHV